MCFELFLFAVKKPHYGRHIGRRIWNLYHQLKLHEPLKILEVGPGNGALCSSIIEYFLEQHPKLHLEMQYHLVELSAKNCTKLNAMIATQQLQANVRCHHKSILDFANPTHKEGHWFVLGFELLVTRFNWQILILVCRTTFHMTKLRTTQMASCCNV